MIKALLNEIAGRLFCSKLTLVTALTAGMAVAAQAEEIHLKFATLVPETNPYTTEFFKPLVDKLNKEGEGEFVIELYHGPTLASAANMWDRITTGVADMGWNAQGNTGVSFPGTTVTALPLLVEDSVAASAALWKLFETGLIADEYKDVKLLALAAFPVQYIHSSRPIRSLEDFAGIKTRGADRGTVDTIAVLGGVPVSVSSPEMYQAFSQGLIQAAITNWTTITPFKLNEVASYHLDLPLGSTPGLIVMNKEAYERLSPKGKEIIDRNSGESLSREFAGAWQAIADDIMPKVLADPKQELVTLTPEEKLRWQEKVGVRQENWLRETPNGAEILKAFKEAYETSK